MKCKNHAFSELKIYSKYLILTKMCNLEIPGLGAHDDPRNSRSTNSGSCDCSHYRSDVAFVLQMFDIL